MIFLSREAGDEIRRHAEREYPHECCGLLIGRIEDEGRARVVVGTYPVANEFDRASKMRAFDESAEATPDATGAEERHRRMLIPPLAYARAEREFAPRGLGVVGNYHSHPEHPAVPSAYDLQHLAPWPTISCVIVSVRGGVATELRSWALADDRSRFNEEAVSHLQ